MLPTQVHVHDKVIDIACGSGPQTMWWLATVAVGRYDTSKGLGWMELGAPLKITRLSTGENVPFDALVRAMSAG